ncbi:hypothetical protein B0T26DRAFT_680980 [Lasiosphaeria miniovina]|uniref:Uncharacterized protein n=1 Tax=Lasiosphaeria miniovina TaxID=1954250 RepID=A0AA40DJ62_9PEZI|nr:uncharacterized protein B0T26DRAFT_680980 [Lasiosphaeria miniovina]KAK0703281.1 hypothetical protein B0T26DRAFT_680980 [Lasiosphaeria miniovina]
MAKPATTRVKDALKQCDKYGREDWSDRDASANSVSTTASAAADIAWPQMEHVKAVYILCKGKPRDIYIEALEGAKLENMIKGDASGLNSSESDIEIVKPPMKKKKVVEDELDDQDKRIAILEQKIKELESKLNKQNNLIKAILQKLTTLDERDQRLYRHD